MALLDLYMQHYNYTLLTGASSSLHPRPSTLHLPISLTNYLPCPHHLSFTHLTTCLPLPHHLHTSPSPSLLRVYSSPLLNKRSKPFYFQVFPVHCFIFKSSLYTVFRHLPFRKRQGKNGCSLWRLSVSCDDSRARVCRRTSRFKRQVHCLHRSPDGILPKCTIMWEFFFDFHQPYGVLLTPTPIVECRWLVTPISGGRREEGGLHIPQLENIVVVLFSSAEAFDLYHTRMFLFLIFNFFSVLEYFIFISCHYIPFG